MGFVSSFLPTGLARTALGPLKDPVSDRRRASNGKRGFPCHAQGQRRGLILRASALPGGPPGDEASTLPAGLEPLPRKLRFLHNDCDFRTFRFHSFFKDNSLFIRYMDDRLLERPHVVLLRPPRFGKSLMCSMLAAYYDFLGKGSFDELFRGLDIHRQLTDEASRCYVIEMQLSKIPQGAWSVEGAFDAVDQCVNLALQRFRKKYGLSFEVVHDCATTLENAVTAVGQATHNDEYGSSNKVFIIIDEYDRVANSIMSQEASVVGLYQAVVKKDRDTARVLADEETAVQGDDKSVAASQGDDKIVTAAQGDDDNVTAAEGDDRGTVDAADGKAQPLFVSPIRRLYSAIKELSANRLKLNVQSIRSFTTGISPVALADASLFNVGTNITSLPEVSAVLGFTAADVEAAIKGSTVVPEPCRKPLLELMRGWFNDYRFFTGKDQPSLFHPMLCMMVLSNAQIDMSFRNDLSKILGMRLLDCDALSAECVDVGEDGRDVEPTRPLPPAFVDLSNVTVHSDLVALLARRWAAVSSFTYEELFAVDAVLPAQLLSVAFKHSELLSPSDVHDCRRLDRLRLLMVYHGLLTCCGVVKVKGVVAFYLLRPTNLSTRLLVRPLRTQLAAAPESLQVLLDSPTTATVASYLQQMTKSSVRRLNEYGHQQGVLEWYESWLRSSGRSDITVTAECKLNEEDAVRYSDIVVRDSIRDRVVVVELKHIPLSMIDVAKWVGGSRRKTAVLNFLRGKLSSVMLTEEALLSLPLVDKYVPNKLVDGRRLNNLLVSDVLDGAIVQLKEQLELYREVKTLSAFVLLQVHRRSVVFPVLRP